jgi:GR25 family glycosyltransferase involved in LPS biosynthesis
MKMIYPTDTHIMCLQDEVHLWQGNGFNIFTSIDTRDHSKRDNELKNHNMELPTKFNKTYCAYEKASDYFDKFPGIVGCYLSHYHGWKKASSLEPNEWLLIIEGDANVSDAKKVLQNGVPFHAPPVNVINLGYRGWKGAEAYLINCDAAKILIDLTGNIIKASPDLFMFKPGLPGRENGIIQRDIKMVRLIERKSFIHTIK